jgi:hypothetical protein
MSDQGLADAPISVAPAKSAAWEDVLDIFYAPRQVFERRRDGKYLVTMLIVGVLTAGTFYLSQQLNDALTEAEIARMVRSGEMPGEQAKVALGFAKKMASLGIVFLPVMTAIGSWISGLILFILGKLMGAKLSFGQGTAIAVLSSMPEVLGRALVGVQGLMLDTSNVAHKYSFSISAARFLDADAGKWMLKLGALADPFVLWGLVLTGMGAYIIGRMEKEKAAVLAIVVGLIGMVLFR